MIKNKIFVMLVMLTSFSFLQMDCKDEPPVKDDGKVVPDTTSHNFSWQTFILGDGNSSELYDIAIINDTLAYAVGVIYIKDSSGQYQFPPYSIAKWNGKNWELKTLYYNSTSAVFPIRGITVLSLNNIWFAAGSIFQWDGISNQTNLRFSRLGLPDPNATVEKIWGTEVGNTIYGVGTRGTLVHFDGTSWQKKDIGTTANIVDVWGITKNGETTVYVPVSDLSNENGTKKIFRIKDNILDSIAWNIDKNVISVWTHDNEKLHAVGSGVFVNENSEWKEMYIPPNISFSKIRGNQENDILIKGSQNDAFIPFIAHYNGNSWKVFEELKTSGTTYNGIGFRGNTIVVVGYSGNRAIAMVGKRSN